MEELSPPERVAFILHDVFSVDTVQFKDGLITEYRRVLNPEKLAHL
jgi:hypothetical protein